MSLIQDLGHLFTLTQDCVVVTDYATDAIVLWSRAAERVTGHAASDVIGRPMLELVAPREVDRWRQARQNGVEMGGLSLLRSDAPTILPLRHASGGELLLEFTALVHEADDGRRYLIGMGRNVTDRTRSEEISSLLLAASQEVAHSSDDEALWTSLHRHATTVTRADAAVVLRWDPVAGDSIVVRNSLPVPVPIDRLPVRNGVVSRAIRQRQTIIVNDYQHQETEIGYARGLGVQATIVAPVLAESRLLGALAVFSRVPGGAFTAADAHALEMLATLVAAAMVSLEGAQLEGALIAAHTVQHEINNLLTLMRGYVELTSADPRLPGDLRAWLLESLAAADRAARLVGQLQSISRVSTHSVGGPFPVLDLVASTQPHTSEHS